MNVLALALGVLLGALAVYMWHIRQESMQTITLTEIKDK
jgi:hypothetical protein